MDLARDIAAVGMFMGALSVVGKAGFVGALTQAIFAPFTVFKALGATAGLIGEIPTAVQRLQGLVKAGIFGGTYCATYDFLRDALDGKIPTWQEVLESYKNGALFSSYLHVGGELISEASPFIKNAYDKATSELSDNMKALKYAWDNVEVPKDIKLGTNGGNIDFGAGKDFVKKYNEGLEKVKNGITPPRYGDRQISDEEYDILRSQTPSQEIRDKVNEGHDKTAITNDEAIPGKTFTGPLEADHIVPMDKITKMDGFGDLSKEQQRAVLNNPENFIGLSKSANTSKGAKSYEEWTHYKKGKAGEIEVGPEFGNRMMKKEKELERKLQKQIDDFNKK